MASGLVGECALGDRYALFCALAVKNPLTLSVGRFVPFAMIPLHTDTKLIRKSIVTGEAVPLRSAQSDTEIWVQVDGKEYWLPSLQQFDSDAAPVRKPPKTDAKKKDS